MSNQHHIEHLKQSLEPIQSYSAGVYKFLEPDSEKRFHKNRKKLGKDWYWFNGPDITYNINNDGFRMNKDFKDVDFNNYFLSIGCSYAFGIGMPYDSLYTSIIAKETNSDAVLLANPGHGMDTFFHNFFVWIETYKKLPNFVILGHTSTERKTFWIGDDRYSYETFISGHTKGKRSRSYKEYLLYETHSCFDYRTKHLAIKNFCKSNNIPLIEFTGFSEPLFDSLNIPDLKANCIAPLARDHLYNGDVLATHPGYDYQENVINYVKGKLGL